uniref:Uncharacterized protein n=1 Tax=Ixodes ricinus TaxID=34613 RepID=A0A6B0UZZ3_IXORI
MVAEEAAVRRDTVLLLVHAFPVAVVAVVIAAVVTVALAVCRKWRTLGRFGFVITGVELQHRFLVFLGLGVVLVGLSGGELLAALLAVAAIRGCFAGGQREDPPLKLFGRHRRKGGYLPFQVIPVPVAFVVAPLKLRIGENHLARQTCVLRRHDSCNLWPKCDFLACLFRGNTRHCSTRMRSRLCAI